MSGMAAVNRAFAKAIKITRRFLEWIDPSFCILVRNDRGDVLLVAQGDWRMGRFPGFEKVKPQ